MSRDFPKLLIALAAAAALGCSGGTGGSSTGADGSTGTSGGGGTSGSGTTGGSAGTTGGSGGDPSNCTIPDAGTVSSGAIDPGNPCGTCDPAASSTSWSPEVICFHCTQNGESGLCTSGGRCCTLRCNGAQCELPDGGIEGQSTCQVDSDCCGIVDGCP